MDSNPLLDTYLRQLRLPAFLKYYAQFASDAARNNEDPVRFLLALAEHEVNQRQQNMLQQRLKMARFPVIKELADFDFSYLPLLNKAQVLDLARGEYIQKKQSLIFIGNPGLGKTQPALCPQKKHICSPRNGDGR